VSDERDRQNSETEASNQADTLRFDDIKKVRAKQWRS
jgi:hypothetical protein